MDKQPFETQRNSADVIIIDALHPEEGALSQALYSRKPKSVLVHLYQILKKGTQSFIGTWYSEYGHKSIGDCGSTTLYFENVSMLAAKAIQNWSLYNGQEASTRYLDFSGRIMINPLAGNLETKSLYIPKENLNAEMLETIETGFKTSYERETSLEAGEQGKMIQEKWMAFYQKHMPIVRDYVASLNPKSDNQNETDYGKAVNARAFDIMRSFIPAGMTTLVSWHSNVRQLRDHLAILKYHPSVEIARIARTAIDGLKSTYPASFELAKKYEETENYLKLRANSTSYYDNQYIVENFVVYDKNLNTKRLESSYKDLLSKRPVKTEVPHEIGEAGTVHVFFKIDFGSFRDAQRHRKGVCKMPLLTTELGFHPWYLERLPEDTRKEAEALIAELVLLIEALPCSKVDRQYYIPMGFMVNADFTWTFDQCVYVAELRSSEYVHPTFRVHAQSLGKWIQKITPDAALYVDWSEDKWSYKRGKQDIVEKEN